MLEQESIYAFLLVIVASATLILNKLRKKDFDDSLFTIFLLSVTLPLLIVKPFCNLLKIGNDFKPLMYFVIALAANEGVKRLGILLRAIADGLIRKENVNKIILFVIQLLTKLQIKENEADGNAKHDNNDN